MFRQCNSSASGPRFASADSHAVVSLISRPIVIRLVTCLMLICLWCLAANAGDIMYIKQTPNGQSITDLTAVTAGAKGTPYGGIAAFFTTPNNQLHVYFVDAAASHVHQFYYNGSSWSDEDLTSSTGGPTAYAYGITGFSIGNLQYVFYVGTDLHVHELNYNNVNWTDYDLTNTVGGNLASPAPLVAFATKPNNQLHVYYQDETSLHEYQLYFNGTSWTYQDLTATIGGAYCYTQWIAGFAVGNIQHLFCPGYGKYSNNLDMLHIYYNNFTWVYEDATFLAGGSQTPMNLGAGVGAFKVLGANQFEVWSVTDDTHLNRNYHVVKPNQWIDWDETNAIGAPANSHLGDIAAFETPGDKLYHIFYMPGDVYHVSYDGFVWTVQDISFTSPDVNSGMAGFGIGKSQNVFYMLNN